MISRISAPRTSNSNVCNSPEHRPAESREAAGDDGHKCTHILALDNGNFAAQPNNRIQWFCPAFITPFTDKPDYLSEAAIELTVLRASDWATRQVPRATTKGDQDANTIFSEIVELILKHHGTPARTTPLNNRDLVDELKALDQRSVGFSQYGLIAPTNINRLVRSIEAAQPETLATINDVLRPYMDGLTARLNALQGAHDSIDSFVAFVNNFFTIRR